jgi:hypothetical protein
MQPGSAQYPVPAKALCLDQVGHFALGQQMQLEFALFGEAEQCVCGFNMPGYIPCYQARQCQFLHGSGHTTPAALCTDRNPGQATRFAGLLE